MALNSDFYMDIFKKEAYWTQLAKDKLLNVYYLDKIKSFYQDKKNYINKELESTNSVLLNNFFQMMDDIIKKIDLVTTNYRKGLKVDINSIVNLFISNKMNNSNINNNVVEGLDEDTDIIRLQVRKKILENKMKKISKESDFDDSYMYDDVCYNDKII